VKTTEDIKTKLKQKQIKNDIIFVQKCSAYLFRAALYKLICITKRRAAPLKVTTADH
jgi:hypothetical protein